MGSKAALAIIALGAILFNGALASPSSCWMNGDEACRAYIGRRLWVYIPSWNKNVVEVTFAHGDWSNTLKLKSGASFVVKGIAKARVGSGDYVVKLNDGRLGWVGMSTPFLLDFDPIARAKQQSEECQRRGQPKIGMTPSQLFESCWGKPSRIIKKTTAQGVQENYIYRAGNFVKFIDGKIAEIVETQ